MKKFVFMLVAVCVFATSALAQIEGRVEIGLGISRLNAEALGQTSVTNLSDLESLKGTRVAAALEFDIAPMLYIAPGLTWHQGKAEYLTNITSSSNQSVKVKAQMLSLPVSLGVRFKPLGILGLSLEAGPYLSYLLKVDQSAPSLSDALSILQNGDDRFSWGIGASLVAELSRFYLRLGLEHALKNRKLPSLQSYKTSKDYNVYLALGLRL